MSSSVIRSAGQCAHRHPKMALQTAGYARYRLGEGDDGDVERGFPRSEEELDEAVASRLARQQVLYRPGKKFHFVLTEAALRY